MSHWLIHFFHWVKLLIFFMFSGILRPYLIIFHKHEQMILFFCRVWIRLINAHLLFLSEIRQIQCTCLNLMLVQCTRTSFSLALEVSKFSARALDLSYFTRKSKCAFINHTNRHSHILKWHCFSFRSICQWCTQLELIWPDDFEIISKKYKMGNLPITPLNHHTWRVVKNCTARLLSKQFLFYMYCLFCMNWYHTHCLLSN